MKLWDMLSHCEYCQKFDVYVSNDYDQNIPIGEGDADTLRREGEDIFDHLMDDIEMYKVHPDGVIVIFVMDHYYNMRAEERYCKDSVQRWDRFNPATRPWRNTLEIVDKHRVKATERL